MRARRIRPAGNSGDDPIELAMTEDTPIIKLMPDEEAEELLKHPEKYAAAPLPGGLHAWVHAQPGGAQRWEQWMTHVNHAREKHYAKDQNDHQTTRRNT